MKQDLHDRPGSFLAHRQCQAEMMDDPGADSGELDRALRFIRRVNRLLGYNRATLSHLRRFSRAWKRGEPIRILDVATGSADVPLAIQRWADRNGWRMKIVALDMHEKTLAAARAAVVAGPRIALLRADALNLPCPDRSFDYALSSMFLHHLSGQQQLRLLAEMQRVASRGVIIADLLRAPAAYRWISLMTLGSNAMVRHDARISVAQAMTAGEVLALRDEAGLRWLEYHPHAAFRFVLAGEKPA